MFDPTLTPEQDRLVETARRFAADKIVPHAIEWDSREEFPTPVFKEAWELGLMNVEIPEAYGGLGLHTIDDCLISEELAYGCAAVATSVMCNHLGALPLHDRRHRRAEEEVARAADQRVLLRAATAAASPTPAPTSPA